LKVSIITVCYNSDKFILDAIESVNNQIYPHIEHIFIDGSSQDNTVKLIKDNASRDITIISELDYGIYDAMNKGLSKAKGDVICFLNSDDFYTDANVITDVVASFNSGHANLLWGDLDYVYPNNTARVFRSIRTGLIKDDDLILGIVPPHPTFFARSCVFRSSELRFDLRFTLAADFDLMKRALIIEDFEGVHLGRVLVQMRHGGATSNGINNVVLQNREIIQSLKESFESFSVIRFIAYKIFKRSSEVVGTMIRYGFKDS
jgi:glycosyltransferase